MERAIFAAQLADAARHAVEFAREFVEEHLPDAVRFRVELNSSAQPDLRHGCGRRGVDVACGRIAVDDDYGDFAKRADPDDFLGWPMLLEVMPADGTRPDDVVPAVAGLMTALIGHGLRVLAQSDYAEQLPGGTASGRDRVRRSHE